MIENMNDVFQQLMSLGFEYDPMNPNANTDELMNYLAAINDSADGVSPVVNVTLNSAIKDLADGKASKHIQRMLSNYKAYSDAKSGIGTDKNVDSAAYKMNHRIIARLLKTGTKNAKELAAALDKAGIKYELPKAGLLGDDFVGKYINRIGKPKSWFDENEPFNKYMDLVGKPRDNKALNDIIARIDFPEEAEDDLEIKDDNGNVTGKIHTYTRPEIEKLRKMTPGVYLKGEIENIPYDDALNSNLYTAKDIEKQLEEISKESRTEARRNGTSPYLTMYYEGDDDIPENIKRFAVEHINDINIPGRTAQWGRELGMIRRGNQWSPIKKKAVITVRSEEGRRKLAEKKAQEAAANKMLDEAFQTGDFSKIPDHSFGNTDKISSMFSFGPDGTWGPNIGD